MNTKTRVYEEMANSITHGAGIMISLVCLTLLVVFSSIYGTPRHVVSCSIFGSSMVLLYSASTIYHSARTPRLRYIFKIIDHACIYLLIAGSYTPFTLITLRGRWGWTLFGVVWGLAVIGIVFKIFFVHRFKIVATLAYILMGWLVIVAIKPLVQNLPPGGLVWLVSGGLAYTLGALFYLWKNLPYSHAVWHLFVLAGSICHFIAVMFYVIPLGT